jgi:ssDNA-binding Zn-finger/Zn-ribbon topoisomerase 1
MALNARGVPTHACPNCGHLIFVIKAMFHDNDIALWFTDAECDDCGTLLTAPCPADGADFNGI